MTYGSFHAKNRSKNIFAYHSAWQIMRVCVAEKTMELYVIKAAEKSVAMFIYYG